VLRAISPSPVRTKDNSPGSPDSKRATLGNSTNVPLTLESQRGEHWRVSLPYSSLRKRHPPSTPQQTPRPMHKCFDTRPTVISSSSSASPTACARQRLANLETVRANRGTTRAAPWPAHPANQCLMLASKCSPAPFTFESPLPKKRCLEKNPIPRAPQSDPPRSPSEISVRK